MTEQILHEHVLGDRFWTFIYMPVGVWILLVILLLVFLIWKYPFGTHWTAENPNPFNGETLGLPRGVFRAILTLTLLFVTIIFELANLYANKETELNIIEFMVAFQMMIAFYFGSKVMHHVTSADKSKTIKTAEHEANIVSQAYGDETDDEFDDPNSAG